MAFTDEELSGLERVGKQSRVVERIAEEIVGLNKRIIRLQQRRATLVNRRNALEARVNSALDDVRPPGPVVP